MLLSTPDNLTFTGRILGTQNTLIDKPSTGTLLLSGNNSGFGGIYRQTGGTTIVEGAYFGGLSGIAGSSVLELRAGANINIAIIGLYDESIMNINTPGNMTFTGNVLGTAGTTISKASTGTLMLSGNNSGFVGTYIQSRGMTVVKGAYFGGISSITGSELELADGSNIDSSGPIYLNSNGRLNITSNGLITFGANQVYGSIEDGAVIDKRGAGELEIIGDNSGFGGLFLQSNGTTTVRGAYFGATSISSISAGVLIFIEGSGGRIGGEVYLGKEGALKIDGSYGYRREMFVENSFLQGGLVQMNLFGGNVVEARRIRTFDIDDNDSSYDLGGSDLINVERGRIVLSTTSQLVLNSNDAFDNSNWRAYKLMKYGGSRTLDDGEFGDVQFNGTLPKNHLIRYDYLGQYIALIAQGYADDRPKFSSLNLCFNQTQVADTFDYFYSEAYRGAPGLVSADFDGDTKELGDKLQDSMDMLSYDRLVSEFKDRLFDLSGYFISNVIISKAYDDAKRDVYNRIYNYKEYEEPAKGIWAQAKVASINTDKDVESPYKFEVSNTDLLAGFDVMTSSTAMVGVYVKNSKSTISQGSDMHKADVDSMGVGVYRGIVKEKWDIKGLVSLSIDNYKTARYIKFERGTKAEGKFSGISTVLDVEGGYRIRIGSNSVLGNVKLRPYIGVGVVLIHIDGFTESKAGVWNLEVNTGNYLKTDVCGGIGFTGNGKKLRWNISCGLGYILAGKNEEITGKFKGGYSLPDAISNMDFRSRSVTLDVISALGDIGFGYYILEELEAYCGGDVRLASMSKDFCANIGIRYSFGRWVDKKESKKVAEVETGNERIKQFRIDAVSFEFDKAEIKPEAEKEIRDLAKKIGRKYNFKKIRIEGHTDSYGSDEYNRKLSLDRAQVVYDVFAKYGIDVAKMEKIGHGESKPIDSNDNEKGRANNRRVEIFVDLY
jgi:outer membrane protein OmpA-like peptidoglycan-associated protein